MLKSTSLDITNKIMTGLHENSGDNIDWSKVPDIDGMVAALSGDTRGLESKYPLNKKPEVQKDGVLAMVDSMVANAEAGIVARKAQEAMNRHTHPETVVRDDLSTK